MYNFFYTYFIFIMAQNGQYGHIKNQKEYGSIRKNRQNNMVKGWGSLDLHIESFEQYLVWQINYLKI